MAQLSSTSYKIQIPGSEKSISFKVEKRGLSYRLLRVLLVLVVVVTFIGNVIFILAALAEMRNHSTEDEVNVRTRGKGSQPEIPGAVEIEDLIINIEVTSSKSNISMKVNGKMVNDVTNFIGIHVMVLNQATGARMASSSFETFTDPKYSDALVQFLNDVTPGRIILFAVKDEASRSLKNNARNMIKSYGSSYINLLKWRDMWAFAVQKRKRGGRVLAEGYQKNTNPYIWASEVTISTSFLASKSTGSHCEWKENDSNRRRKEFCEKYEVYPLICRCENPTSVEFDNPPFTDGSRSQLPVSIIAGNRPRYLFRMLRGLQKVVGLNASMVSLFIDGFFEEPASIGKLFNIKVYPHKSLGARNARIAQHYKKSLTTSFDNNPAAQYLVILEEDLDVSVDILSFFQQLLPVLEKDESLFCISAWNDQGYKHTAYDPSMTYRVEYMPGLGWVLPRKIYKQELEPNWPTPDKMWDWDMWVRALMLKQRECIIPDISRTYHFGDMGLNVNPFFQSLYFKRRSFNVAPPVKLDPDIMYKEEYEKEMRSLIRSAAVLDHSKTPCSHPDSFVPDTFNKTYVFYLKMTRWDDNRNWLNAATCFKIWDIDMRGYHKGLFRIWINGNHVMLVGCPDAPYCDLKPSDITPVDVFKRKAKNQATQKKILG